MVNLCDPAARARGFTLIELLVVMAIVALLASLAAPRYFDSVDRARERVLMQNLNLMRDAIDKFHADTGGYPPDLTTLVTRRYLRKLPRDPITGSDETWQIVAPPFGAGAPRPGPQSTGSGVYDVRSGAPGSAPDGTAYGSW